MAENGKYAFHVKGESLVVRQEFKFLEPYNEDLYIEASTLDEAVVKFKEKYHEKHWRPDEIKNLVEEVVCEAPFYDKYGNHIYIDVRIYEKKYTSEEIFGE